MKKTLTPIAALTLIALASHAQQTEIEKLDSTYKKTDTVKIRGFHISRGKSGPFVKKMGTDTVHGPVKMPNGYRESRIEPVSMPTYRIGEPGEPKVRGLNIQNLEKPKKNKKK
ncbi:hypothetical protein [Pedobacter faecalis]|uniref:hypothetical protein n=1 Tax=Pedobacter faecalis TaxID=3041495 RepID=UPI0025515339|nr:hypothetical protein [Pedobacter sp. ELA7]